MTEIIQSIHKSWIDLIGEGVKTLELRKSKPTNMEYPIRVYMYETKIHGGRGIIVGEYTLKTEPSSYLFEHRDKLLHILEKNSCVKSEDIIKYYQDKGTVYAWRVSDVKLYAEPKPLSDFNIKYAPQSWCYLKRDLKS